MSDLLEKWEEDQNWLLLKRPGSTEAELEAFAEKVALKCGEGIEEDEAREQAERGE